MAEMADTNRKYAQIKAQRSAPVAGKAPTA
jgi:hypothetical protein